MSRPAHNGTINRYRCPNCGSEWKDEWCCGCDDDCPQCGTNCSPEESQVIAACTHEECLGRRIELLNLVLSVSACAGAKRHPKWAVIEVKPDLVSRIKRMRDACNQGRLAGVFDVVGLDTWDRRHGCSVQGERLIVEPDRFYFRAHQRGTEYEVETVGVAIDTLLSLLEQPTWNAPAGWEWRYNDEENTLYVSEDSRREALSSLIKSFHAFETKTRKAA